MDARSPIDARASGLMLLLCLVWSLQQVSLKWAAVDVAPMTMVALRSGIAALLLAVVMAARHELPSPATGRWRPGIVAGLLFGAEYLFVAEGLRFSHAAHVVVFLYTAPVFAALGLHWKLPAERLTPAQWLGIALAFGGIVIAFLGRGGDGAAAAERAVLLGDLLALLAGIAWGLTTVLIRCSSLSAAPATETLFYQLVVAFALLLPAAIVGGQLRFVPTAPAWWHLAFQSLVVSFGSLFVWFWLLRRYLASRLGVFSFLTPVFGVVLGVLLLDEPLDPSFVAGGLLVLLGIVMVNVRGAMNRIHGRA